MIHKNEAPADSPKSTEAQTNNTNKSNISLFDSLDDNQTLLAKSEENNPDIVNGNKQVSVFRNHADLIENVELSSIIHDIQNGKYKPDIERMRASLKENNHIEFARLKKKLIGFTPSGTFNNGRKAKDISTYNSCIILDIDKLTPEQLIRAKETAVSIPYTYAAFVSPSGNGLKIIVTIDRGREHHAAAIVQISRYYYNRINLPVDPSGKDVSRLCYVSYDPDCYLNPIAEKFSIAESLDFQKKIRNQVNGNTDIAESPDLMFRNCVEFTERKSTYCVGNRNNFIHQLACNCNRKGIPESTALSFIIQSYDLEEKELTKTVESAYKNNSQEHANSANSANFASFELNDSGTKEIRMAEMPYLPDDIFDTLPFILKEGSKVFINKRERDVFMTGALAIISGCMPNVVGLYNGKTVYANLYVFVVAPAATGKGALQFSKELGMSYHNALKKNSTEQRRVFEVQMEEYKRTQYKGKGKDEGERMEIPEKPPFKILYIPANNSSARVIQHLIECERNGIFCETEADTMGNVLKQDWGSYSDLLRKGFHHETISYSRKTNNEYFEVENPRLSVALAGTPGQVEGLIKSAEDGLFSRFLFYAFRSDIEWIDAGAHVNGYNLTQHFEALSVKVLKFVEFLAVTRQINFTLSDQQWEKLNEFGRKCIKNLTAFISEDMAGTAKRLGLILYRVAMIITALRYFDNGEVPIHMTCSTDDFSTALKLVSIYQEHSAFMYAQLPKSTAVTDKTLKKFFDLLPDEFLRKEAVAIALTINFKERTADGYLSRLVSSKLLEQDKLGHYSKVKK